MHLRTAIALLIAVVVAACSGGDDSDAQQGVVQPDQALPAQLVDFLDRVAPTGTVAFSATYDVVQKLGPVNGEVRVTSAPPSWRIDVDDLIVVDGARKATCHRSTATCEPRIREDQLAFWGVWSRFFSVGPTRATRAAARRVGADSPEFSSRTVAGLPLDCVAVPHGGATPSVACLTPEGIWGLIDNPSVRVALTAYSTAPPPPITLPYPIA